MDSLHLTFDVATHRLLCTWFTLLIDSTQAYMWKTYGCENAQFEPSML